MRIADKDDIQRTAIESFEAFEKYVLLESYSRIKPYLKSAVVAMNFGLRRQGNKRIMRGPFDCVHLGDSDATITAVFSVSFFLSQSLSSDLQNNLRLFQSTVFGKQNKNTKKT